MIFKLQLKPFCGSVTDLIWEHDFEERTTWPPAFLTEMSNLASTGDCLRLWVYILRQTIPLLWSFPQCCSSMCCSLAWSTAQPCEDSSQSNTSPTLLPRSVHTALGTQPLQNEWQHGLICSLVLEKHRQLDSKKFTQGKSLSLVSIFLREKNSCVLQEKSSREILHGCSSLQFCPQQSRQGRTHDGRSQVLMGQGESVTESNRNVSCM